MIFDRSHPEPSIWLRLDCVACGREQGLDSIAHGSVDRQARYTSWSGRRQLDSVCPGPARERVRLLPVRRLRRHPHERRGSVHQNPLTSEAAEAWGEEEEAGVSEEAAEDSW